MIDSRRYQTSTLRLFKYENVWIYIWKYGTIYRLYMDIYNIWTSIEISSKKRILSRILKNGLVQSIPESLKRVQPRRELNSKKIRKLFYGPPSP